jgi:hypothetical protein
MDKKQISEFMEDPSSLDSSTLTEIADLVKQFPFCQTLRLLHLYNLKSTGNINYHTQLKIAAIYSTDRKRLYSLLNDEMKPATKKLIVQANVPVYEEAFAADEKLPQMPETEHDRVEEPGTHSPDFNKENKEQKIELKTNSPLSAAEIIENRLREISGRESRVSKPEEYAPGVRDTSKPDPTFEAEMEQEPADMPDYREVQTEDLNQTAEATLVRSKENIETTSEIKTEESLEIPATEAINDENESTEGIESYSSMAEKENITDIEEDIPDETVAGRNTKEPEPPEATNKEEVYTSDKFTEDKLKGRHSFTVWLKLLKNPAGNNPQEIQDPEMDSDTEPVASEPPEKKTSDLVTKIPASVQKEIIEKFIKQNPKIVSGKAEFFSPLNMAKNSSVEHEDIFSETLADILFKQALYEKSKAMYQKLILNYPKKSSYFAERIKEINEIINK